MSLFQKKEQDAPKVESPVRKVVRRRGYVPPVVDFGRVRPTSKTIPDQAMSIQTIYDKYTRNLPVHVKQFEPAYHPDSEIDLEKVARSPFDEQADFAEMQKAEAAEVKRELRRREREQRAREAEEKAQAQQAEARTGIDSLDNTMPVDTSKGVK